MLISTRGRYALRVMIDLAENRGDGYIPMKEVAARQEISLKYLERILPVLVQNGMIEGQHGKSGGYRLTREPGDYRVGDILRLTEGELAPVACLCSSAEPCTRTEQCRTHSLWTGLDRVITDYLDGVTLYDLMQKSV
jgi:Rrf2 family protein